jgi:ribonucleotide reductase alpha subunit
MDGVDVAALVQEITGFISDGTTTTQIAQIVVASAKAHRAENAAYDKLATRLLLKELYSEAIQDICPTDEFSKLHQHRFSYSIQDAVHADQLAPELLMYDLEFLSTALKLERDELIACDGLEWLYDMCLAKDSERRVETPQYFWMRIAMALAANEGDEKEQRAVEFYEILSSLRFVPSEKLLRTSGRATSLHGRISAETEESEITSRAVGHVNLTAIVRAGAIDEMLLFETVTSAVRFLDDAIDLSKYRLDATAQHAREHREIALGMVGYDQAGDAAERCSESVAFYATLASANLAAERGAYPSHSDSNWNIGALPFESLKLLQPGSSSSPEVNCLKDWLTVRAVIRQHGIRNGHLLALTPAHVVEKFIKRGAAQGSFTTELNQLVRCRKWVDGPVYLTLPAYLNGPDMEQACVLAQQLGIRAYVPPTRLTISDTHPFIDAAAATKVLKSIEKS